MNTQEHMNTHEHTHHYIHTHIHHTQIHTSNIAHFATSHFPKTCSALTRILLITHLPHQLAPLCGCCDVYVYCVLCCAGCILLCCVYIVVLCVYIVVLYTTSSGIHIPNPLHHHHHMQTLPQPQHTPPPFNIQTPPPPPHANTPPLQKNPHTLLAMMAMSDVGSFNGNTSFICLLNTCFPLRNGGLVSCTRSMARTSSSLLKSRSTCVCVCVCVCV